MRPLFLPAPRSARSPETPVLLRAPTLSFLASPRVIPAILSFRRNRLCKNSENPEPPEKLPTGMANIRHSRAAVRVKTRKSRTARKTTYWHGKYPPFPRRRESSANTARNAHIRAMAPAGGGASLWLSAAPSLRPEGARSARLIRWIPACAGMARGGMGMAE